MTTNPTPSTTDSSAKPAITRPVNYSPSTVHRRLMNSIEQKLSYKSGDVTAWQAAARDRLITPVSAIACSTSRLRFCARARLRVGASRDGAWTMPASIRCRTGSRRFGPCSNRRRKAPLTTLLLRLA